MTPKGHFEINWPLGGKQFFRAANWEWFGFLSRHALKYFFSKKNVFFTEDNGLGGLADLDLGNLGLGDLGNLGNLDLNNSDSLKDLLDDIFEDFSEGKWHFFSKNKSSKYYWLCLKKKIFYRFWRRWKNQQQSILHSGYHLWCGHFTGSYW